MCFFRRPTGSPAKTTAKFFECCFVLAGLKLIGSLKGLKRHAEFVMHHRTPLGMCYMSLDTARKAHSVDSSCTYRGNSRDTSPPSPAVQEPTVADPAPMTGDVLEAGMSTLPLTLPAEPDVPGLISGDLLGCLLADITALLHTLPAAAEPDAAAAERPSVYCHVRLLTNGKYLCRKAADAGLTPAAFVAVLHQPDSVVKLRGLCPCSPCASLWDANSGLGFTCYDTFSPHCAYDSSNAVLEVPVSFLNDDSRAAVRLHCLQLLLCFNEAFLGFCVEGAMDVAWSLWYTRNSRRAEECEWLRSLCLPLSADKSVLVVMYI